jgi:type I restriction enzyme R subunit
MVRFKLKARHFLRAHEDHIAIARLRRNEPLTPTDLLELERIFTEAGLADAGELDAIRANGGLGLFIRSLIGLDREAAKAAFSSFTGERSLSANQIEFLNSIIDHLTEKGQMDVALLYESPFTDFDPLGVAGVFSENDTRVLAVILQQVASRAAA